MPNTRSSNRAPHAISRSQRFIAQLAAFDPCMPGSPMHSGCESGKTPFAMRVVMTGICTASATRISSAGSTFAETAPPPTYRTGRRALASALAASLICFELPSTVGW